MRPEPAFVRKLKQFDSDLDVRWNNAWRAYRRKDTGELVKDGRWQIMRKTFNGAVLERTVLGQDRTFRGLDDRVFDDLAQSDFRRTLGEKTGEPDEAMLARVLKKRAERDEQFESEKWQKEQNKEQDNLDYTRKNLDGFFSNPHSVS